MNEKSLLIAGAWRNGAHDELIELRAPFDKDLLARVTIASGEDVDEAIFAAQQAQAELRRLPRHELAKALRHIADVIHERREEFARTIAREAAKPIRLARAEVERAVQTFTFAGEEAKRFTGEIVPVDAQHTGEGRFAWTEVVPRGVVFGIAPFNFPLNLVAHKVAPALASRNAIILKPSPRTPLSSLLLAEVFLTSGLPAAALQVVTMNLPEIDQVLKDERVALVSFTGSAEVGWNLRTRAGRKTVVLELGGNAPVIVDETADLSLAVERSAMSAFAYAGQTCISAQRIIVHEKLAREFTESFVARAREMIAGDPLDERVDLSVMIDEAAATRTANWIREATSAGARLLCGGNRSGAMLDATVLTDVHNEMRVVNEEVFAPVATVQTFTDFDEAIAQANNTKYGLQAALFTRDMSHTLRAARELDYGGVIVNDAPSFRVDNMPYGGMKLSGAGREGVRSAMQDMTETRTVVILPEQEIKS